MRKTTTSSSTLRKISPSEAVRARLDHPVIDSGLYTIEFAPVLEDYVARQGGVSSVDKFRSAIARAHATEGESSRCARTAASLPRLLHERIAESGTDYALLFPRVSTFAMQLDDPDLRRALVRAVNEYHRDVYAPYADRLTPAAAIPLHTPEEGVEELEFAISGLGLKVASIPSNVRRPLRSSSGGYPSPRRSDFPLRGSWLDTFGRDSEYDYDAFWAKAVALRTVLTTHATGADGTERFASPEALAKSLFLGGVTRRFPALRVGFLGAGAGWGARLHADLVGHWEAQAAERGVIGASGASRSQPQELEAIDEFARAGISQVGQIRERYVQNFYFGSEANDPALLQTFDGERDSFGIELNSLWASGGGALASAEVLSETWQLVQRGAISEQVFKDLVFTRPYRFLSGKNAEFFRGTRVEQMLACGRAA